MKKADWEKEAFGDIEHLDKTKIAGKIWFESTHTGEFGLAGEFSEYALARRIRIKSFQGITATEIPKENIGDIVLPGVVKGVDVAFRSKIVRLFKLDEPNTNILMGMPVPHVFTKDFQEHNSWIVVTEMSDEPYTSDEFLDNVLGLMEEKRKAKGI